MKRIASTATAAALACLLAAAQPSPAGAGARLDPNVAPIFQRVELRIDAREPDYSGSVRIDLRVEQATDSFRFHAEGQSFERVALRDLAGEAYELELERGDEGLVIARSSTELAPGFYTLAIDFTNAFNTQAVGLYRMEAAGHGYLFTQFESVDARKAFPCWDEPIYKIPYQMVLEAPAEFETLANMPIAAEARIDGWKRLVFEITPPTSSYLLALASGPLESVPIPGLKVPGRVVTVAGQSSLADAAIDMTPPMLEALEEYFGSPYPYSKLDLIAVPEYWFGAMENPGAITFADDVLLLDPSSASVSDRRFLAIVVAHELAHQWFGDLVTMEWWDDLWLNESFASWLASKVVDDLYPQFRVPRTNLRRLQQTMEVDARPSTRQIRRPVTQSSQIFEDLQVTYNKGGAVLDMVERWLGEDVFRRGVVSYINANAWGNAVGADLWAALGSVSDLPVDAVMASFLDQSGMPLLTFEPTGDGVRVTQRRFLNHGIEADDQIWTVPVRLRYGVGGEVRRLDLLVDSVEQTIPLPPGVDWIQPDEEARGYYRWSVPRDMLLTLARNSVDVMTPRERIGFLGNAAALLDAGELSGARFLEIVGAFAADPEPTVVRTVLASLVKVETAFVSDELRDEFAGFVRATLRPALERFGLEASSGELEEVSLLRPQLFDVLGDDGRDPQVRAAARRLADAYMEDPATVDPSLAAVALQIAAIEGDRSLFEAYRERFETAATPADRERYLDALGNFRLLADDALAYTMTGPLRPPELGAIPGELRDSEAGRDRVFDWIMANYEAITSRIPPAFSRGIPVYASGCSEARLARARDFFSRPENQVEGTMAVLDKVADEVADCVNLRRREGAAVEAFLGRDTSAGGGGGLVASPSR